MRAHATRDVPARADHRKAVRLVLTASFKPALRADDLVHVATYSRCWMARNALTMKAKASEMRNMVMPSWSAYPHTERWMCGAEMAVKKAPHRPAPRPKRSLATM